MVKLAQRLLFAEINVGLLSDQRRRRWANIKPTLALRLLFTVICLLHTQFMNNQTLINCHTQTNTSTYFYNKQKQYR